MYYVGVPEHVLVNELMNLLFCILRSLPGTFVHVLILGLKELKVDYLVMPACTKSLIVQEIKTDSGLA